MTDIDLFLISPLSPSCTDACTFSWGVIFFFFAFGYTVSFLFHGWYTWAMGVAGCVTGSRELICMPAVITSSTVYKRLSLFHSVSSIWKQKYLLCPVKGSIHNPFPPLHSPIHNTGGLWHHTNIKKKDLFIFPIRNNGGANGPLSESYSVYETIFGMGSVSTMCLFRTKLNFFVITIRKVLKA